MATQMPLSGGALRRREALTCLGVALLAAWGVYLAHVIQGGWYLDDWINIAIMRDAGSATSAFAAMNDVTYRPGLSLTLVLFYEIAGEAPSTYLAVGVAITALQAGLFYLVLRALKFNVVVASLAGAMFLVLPCIDATRLWMTALPIQISGALYLLGVLVALNGLRRSGFRSRVTLHLAAVGLFVAAMLTYELIAGVVVATSMLYAVQGGVRRAVPRMLADWASVAVVLYVLAQRAVDDRGANTSVGYLWDRAQQMWTPAWQVFRSLVPWSEALAGRAGALLLLLGVTGAVVAIKGHSRAAPGLRAWLAVAATSLVFALAGLVMLLPADPYFIPRASGLGNRVGAFAAFGAVVLLIALIAITCGGIGALFGRPAAGFALALAITCVATSELTVREVEQQRAWAQAWDEQVAVVSAVNAAIGGQAVATTAVVTFKHTTFILPADVSVFAYSWDLRGALMNLFRAPTAYGHPWVTGSRCGPEGVLFPDGVGAPDGADPYGYSNDLVFVDAAAVTAQPITNKRACDQAVTTLTGGTS